MKINQIEYHRNGVCGVGFNAVLFTIDHTDDRGYPGNYLAIVFPDAQETAVINLDRIAEHGVTFGDNSWRGDLFNQELREAIAKIDALTPDEYVAHLKAQRGK